MAKQGAPKRAWNDLMIYLNTQANTNTRRYIYTVVGEYCRGLNNIERIPDYNIRQRVRDAWRESNLRQLDVHCVSHLPPFELNLLRNAMVAFYREKVRIDVKTTS